MTGFPSEFQIIDISPPIRPDSAVFPGDTPFSFDTLLSMHKGDNITLGSITTTTHIGAHADAPAHYSRSGATIDQRPLSLYIGPCTVVDVTHTGKRERIGVDEVDWSIRFAPRVLFKTDAPPQYGAFDPEFRSLSPGLITRLASLGVHLVGIDTPSIDPATSQDLPSHAAVARHDMAVLEGLDLRQAAAREYWLIALPLRLEKGDASPVRALLVYHRDEQS